MPRVPSRLLCEQAQDMQERYPELYAYLQQRDAELLRNLRRIPSPADVTLSATFDLRGQLNALRKALDGGLTSLTDSNSIDGTSSP